MKSQHNMTANAIISHMWIDICWPKEIQKVFNRISWLLDQKDLDFEESQGVLRDILKYPGIWDEWNISKFIDIFHRICKIFSNIPEKRMTLIGTWKQFNELRDEQEMQKITIHIENDIAGFLSSKGNFVSAAGRIEGRPIRG